MLNSDDRTDKSVIYNVLSLIYLIIILLIVLIYFIYQITLNTHRLSPYTQSTPDTLVDIPHKNNKIYDTDSKDFWVAPDLNDVGNIAMREQIEYGHELIVHTSLYLGPKGKVAPISNGLNCQNCHLEAGTKIYGNNYGSVGSLYPKFRSRSGSIENIEKRINDCIERSLNGVALDSSSAEIQAIKAYMLYLGSNVVKGTQVKGSGLKDIDFLTRSADPTKGKDIYMSKCASCHQSNGQGLSLDNYLTYVYPPLWGPYSYNVSAGMYRVSTLARYVKYNMPLGAVFDAPQLTDEEAWDVAAYINTQPRPDKRFLGDWPNIAKKPIDHPYGPYADTFSAEQHKFGPFQPIQTFYSK